MYKITFIEPDGTPREVEAKEGDSLMSCAVENLVDGILADCGGSGVCGTCRGRIAAEWQEKIGPRNEEEELMIEISLDPTPECRLTCQIQVNESLNGIVVTLPESQE